MNAGLEETLFEYAYIAAYIEKKANVDSSRLQEEPNRQNLLRFLGRYQSGVSHSRGWL